MYSNDNGEIFVFCSPKLLLASKGVPDAIRRNIIFRAVPAASPVEYRREVVPYRLSCSTISDDEKPTPSNVVDVLTDFSTYTEAPPGMREIYQVSPVFVAKLAHGREKTLWQLFKANPDMVNYEHAAIFLWWVLIPDHLYEFFLSTSLHLVNVQQHNATLSELFEVCRQQAACCPCAVGVEAFFWLRKYKNLFGRRRGECDIEQENKRYEPHYSYRRLGPIGGHFTRHQYLLSFKKHVQKVTDAIIVNLRTQKLDSLQEWWEKRVNNIASGSSSNRHRLDEFAKNDSRISSSDRPNKKAVCETYDDDYLWRILQKKPLMIARRSTKNEPGLKQRALYAVDDDAVIISAYASMGVEKAMNVMGMAPLQRPLDVLQWWKHGVFRTGEQIWLSADYTDFNKEHSAVELELLNVAFAKSWLTKHHDAKLARQKATCALWVASAQRNRFVKEENGELRRVFSALFSGSRDTARDNTILHQVYHNIITEWLDSNMPQWGKVVHAHMCGDDEDVLFSDCTAAAAYYHAIKVIGWHTNDSKQMCGRTCHEFLQKFPHHTKGCIAPISSMISALCSGQWYTQPGLQQDNALAAISDQMWELIVRGADAKKVYCLAVDILNDYMQVKWREHHAGVVERAGAVRPGASVESNQNLIGTQNTVGTLHKKKLEWWRFRLGKMEMPTQYLEKANIIPNNTTFLWQGTISQHMPEPHEVAPTPFFYVQYAPTLPHKASQAWCNRWYEMFSRYGKEHMFPNYVLTVKANSYGSLYHTYWQALKKEWLITHWPERTTTTDHEMKFSDSVAEFVTRCKRALHRQQRAIFAVLLKQSIKVDMATVPQQLARQGADPIMFEMLGGTANKQLMQELRLQARANTRGRSWLDAKPKLVLPHMLLDPALRSFLTAAGPD